MQRQYAADNRARRLLIENLDPVQRTDFEQAGSFIVTGPSGNRYRIEPPGSANGNIVVYPAAREYHWCIRWLFHAHYGTEPFRLCLMPPLNGYYWSIYDVMLTQKFMLELQEYVALKVGGRWNYVGQLYGDTRLYAGGAL